MFTDLLGVLLGDRLGLEDGNEDGIILGKSLGSEDGATLGKRLGFEDGIVLGESLGRKDDIFLGRYLCLTGNPPGIEDGRKTRLISSNDIR